MVNVLCNWSFLTNQNAKISTKSIFKLYFNVYILQHVMQPVTLLSVSGVKIAEKTLVLQVL